jgi:hypothetical protein
MTGTVGRSSDVDFHLVESSDGWALTINLTRRMLDAFVQDESVGGESSANPGTGFTVHIEPNLVPGQPFPATVLITRPGTPN